MNKGIKIFLAVVSTLFLLVILAFLALYFIGGINYLTLRKTFAKSEITETALLYNSAKVLLIKKEFFEEYGRGRFPKYKIYNGNGIQLDIYQCYESLPDLPKIIQSNSSIFLATESFEHEIAKIRNTNNDITWRDSIFVREKYNMIFYYKNAMNRLQKKQLANILNHNLGSFNDSMNVIFVNVDRVDF